MMETQPHDGRPPAPVLVVEDDADTRELLRAALEGEGLAVATAAQRPVPRQGTLSPSTAGREFSLRQTH